MAMGKRETAEQRELFVMADKLPRSPGHVFYDKLNRVLREGGFDAHSEKSCEPFYAQGKGRPSLPPGIYFRMLLVGYFEGINSQRGIAWRCSDSLSLRQFLGIALDADSPDHSWLSYIRNRLPLEVHQQVFVWILALANEKKLLKGKTVRVWYACWHCEEQVSLASMPPQSFAKSLPRPGLLAQTLVYGDHAPLYRQEGIATRQGLILRRSTLRDWIAASTDTTVKLLDPLFDQARTERFCALPRRSGAAEADHRTQLASLQTEQQAAIDNAVAAQDRQCC